MTDRNPTLNALEENVWLLYLVAVVPVTAFAVNTYLLTHEGTSYEIIGTIVGPAGWLIGALGLVGLTPPLADRRPTLARVAAGIAVIPAVLWGVIILRGIGEELGLLGDWSSGPAQIIPPATIATMILAFGLFGVVILYTRAHSRLIGGLLLLEAAMFVALIGGFLSYFMIDVGHVVAFLGLGITLRITDGSSGSTGPAPDSTA